MTSLIDSLRRNSLIAPLATQLVRGLRSMRRAAPWKSELVFDLWADQINTVQSEELAGICAKVDQFRQIGSVWVVGGKTTPGNDQVFLCDPEHGKAQLLSLMADVPLGDYLLIYAPHPFWTPLFGSQYRWIPSWEDLYWLVYWAPDWRIVQHSPSFDAPGRYFLVAQKTPRQRDLIPVAELSRRVFHVFYFREGADLALSRSNYALSAHLCSALARTGANVYAHDMNDVGAVEHISPDDILVGHVGAWVKAAHNRGLRHLVLFNPINRWYATRHSRYFEENATIDEQVRLAKMVIAQSGAVWRMTGAYPFPEKWRWIDLGIDPTLFPNLKRSFAPPGRRKLLCYHLYDSEQKGADLAEQIIRSRPEIRFWWVGGKLIRGVNVSYHGPVSNTSRRFRRIAQECDFVLLPSREDAQPGTFIEAASLGLLPIASYNSGYSLSFPILAEPNTVDTWLRIVDIVQQASDSSLCQAQQVVQHYLRTIHAWNVIEQQIVFYLREAPLVE